LPDGSEVTTALTATTGPFTPAALATDPNNTMYAFSSVAGVRNHLFTIATDGSVTDIGAVTGLADVSMVGATFGPDGTLYAVTGAGATFKIDVAAMTASGFPGTSSTVAGDFVFVGDQLYALQVNRNTIARVDMTTGALTVVPITSFSPALTGFVLPTSLWSFSGHLYAGYSGTPNHVYEIFDYDSAAATAVHVASFVANPGDGTSCLSAPSPLLDAANDDFTGSPVGVVGGGTAGNVLTNDTRDGVAVNAADVTSSVTDDDGLTGVAIAADGSLTVPAGASPGTYEVTYKICRTDNTVICDSAVAKVTVARDNIDAVDDSFDESGGNVLTNDTLKGAAADAADVGLTLTNDGGLSGAVLASDGVLSVPANASPGTYTLTYELCQSADPSNCDTASITVVVPDPNADSDKDGLTDGKEASLHSNPNDPDTDDDGFKDGTEYFGITLTKKIVKCNGVRVAIGKVRTNVLKADTDGDGYSDRVEVSGYYGVRKNQRILTPHGGSYILSLLKSNPARADTDGDRLSDRVEARGLATKKFNYAKTDPTNCHSDFGDVDDGTEARSGRNPTVAGKASH
jgi:hypothetical protein